MRFLLTTGMELILTSVKGLKLNNEMGLILTKVRCWLMISVMVLILISVKGLVLCIGMGLILTTGNAVDY